MSIDILLVNPPSPDGSIIIRDVNRSGRKTRERMIWPQTNLAYLAALVRDQFSVEIIDAIAEDINWDKFKQILKDKEPRYVVSNIISTTLTNDMYTMFLAKSLGAITIGMGPHLTDRPEESLIKFPSLDFAIMGESELTFVELIDVLENNDHLEAVKGIAFRNGSNVQINEERPFIENLDDLPMPAHDLLPLQKYRMPFFGHYTFVVAGRGCPYRCVFCRQNVMWKSIVRMRSADSLLEEVKYLLRLGVDNIMFQADTFTADKKMVKELCKKIIKEKLRFRWACNTHIATIDQEMVDLMKQAGCWMIAPGIESCSDKVLKNIRKQITVKRIYEVVEMIHRAGIEVWGYFVYGLPGDTKDTLEENTRCALELSLDMANFAVAAPYPGTPFYHQAVENNWLVSAEWEDFDQNYSAIVDYGYLKPEDIIKAIKKANVKFFSRPKHAWRVFREIFKDFGMAKSLFKILIEHLSWVKGKQ